MERGPKPFSEEKAKEIMEAEGLEERSQAERDAFEAERDNQKEDMAGEEKTSSEIMLEKIERYGRIVDQPGNPYHRTSIEPFKERLTMVSQNNAEKIAIIDCDHDLGDKVKIARNMGFSVIIANEEDIDLYKDKLESEEKVIVILNNHWC